ncbi:aldo/keto reductase family protein [Legionella massiliensis]|nr:aldo/keto reductase [Legionella massiliensis]
MALNQRSNKLSIPSILYGTAWKEADTELLVTQALTLGYEGIDTANQRKHYFEEGVGLAVQRFLKTSDKTRADLFLQTKFTSINGQDSRLPYDEFASLTNQVKQSFASSLNHLQTDYIDSYILHGPTMSRGIIDADLEIWQAMETLVHEGKVKFLGISNVNIQQVEELYNKVLIKPSFIQNRCFAISRWDQNLRLFCKTHKIIYQGFSLLTANLSYLATSYMQKLALKYDKTIPQLIFRFALHKGMLPLTGSTNSQHMQDDLDINDFELSDDEVNHIENIAISLK